MLRKFTYLLLLISLCFVAGASQACVLVMGYQNKAKTPLIAKNPDNSGIYFDLYSVVAEKVGCELAVIRQPKKRILTLMKSGEADFYPGMKFTQERAKFAYFIENGLPTGRIGVSSVDLHEISHIGQLKGKRLMIALGGVDYAKDLNDKYKMLVANLDMEKAVKMLKSNRGDFFATDPIVVHYYLRTHSITDIKIHQKCCGGEKSMYMGFSRASRYFKEQPKTEAEITNKGTGSYTSMDLSPGSLVREIRNVLKVMNDNGETQSIFKDGLDSE